MRAILNWLRIWPLLAALAIGGCAAVQPLPAPVVAPEASAAAKAMAKAQQAVNEANVALTSINKAITSGVSTGMLSVPSAKDLGARADKLGAQVDNAQRLIRLGKGEAVTEAELVRSLVLALYAEVRPILEKEAAQ